MKKTWIESSTIIYGDPQARRKARKLALSIQSDQSASASLSATGNRDVHNVYMSERQSAWIFFSTASHAGLRVDQLLLHSLKVLFFSLKDRDGEFRFLMSFEAGSRSVCVCGDWINKATDCSDWPCVEHMRAGMLDDLTVWRWKWKHQAHYIHT
jgi:hypothetical protein